jgi:hypothetical protein
VFERMKAGWTVTVTSASLTVLQIQGSIFLDIADKALVKRLFNEAAFRNSYYAGRAGFQLDLPLVAGLNPKSRRVRLAFRPALRSAALTSVALGFGTLPIGRMALTERCV